MQTYFIRNLGNIFFLFIFYGIIFQATAQDKSVTLKSNFSNVESDVSAKSESFELIYKNSSPFVMLSGYTDNLNFNNTVYYRLKSNNKWSQWTAFKKPHYGGETDRYVLGEVFIEQAFNDIQFKTKKPTETKFIFRLFFPEFTKKIKKSNSPNKQTLAECSQPAFQGRNDWCPSGDCPKINGHTISPTHIVIHHSAGQTNSTDYAAVVRGYWDYHVNTNGWDDIGYNWLVDPNGVLYEGRGDRKRGAHSPCMNAISTGICYIGNYENNQPVAAGLTALENFIAWDATDKNIDVKTSSYVSGLGTMPHVSGHKDGKEKYPSSSCSSTLCPGVFLSNKIQTIINNVTNLSCYSSSVNALEAPTSFSVIRKSNSSVEITIKAVVTANKYNIYQSNDNVTFQKVKESPSTIILVDNLNNNEVYYFKVEAINNDGISDKSSVLSSVPSTYGSEILIVDGVERRQWDVLADYEYPLRQLNRTYSSATNNAIKDGLINLEDFKIVIWSLLDESTADDTFDKSEQTIIKNYIDNGGVFIVSGNEIGWDLVNKGDATDKIFYETVLKAKYVADSPSPLNYLVKDNNNISYDLVQNPNDILDGRWPDAILPNGSTKTFTFDGVTSNTAVAGIGYKTSQGGVEYLSFAIESITSNNQRKDLLEYLLNRYSSILAVDDTFIKQNIRLYPNPTSGTVYISNPNFVEISKIKIFNIYGQELKNTIQNNEIKLSNFVPGIYFIKIESINNKQGTFKVIKS